MVLGNALNPRVFEKKSGEQLGFDYHANKKAWMTTTLFFGWLRRFQDYVAKTPERKVVLRIDNCNAHGWEENIPKLPKERIAFLPPNCTSKIQPLDAGIIAALKISYRKFHMERAFGQCRCKCQENAQSGCSNNHEVV